MYDMPLYYFKNKSILFYGPANVDCVNCNTLDYDYIILPNNMCTIFNKPYNNIIIMANSFFARKYADLIINKNQNKEMKQKFWTEWNCGGVGLQIGWLYDNNCFDNNFYIDTSYDSSDCNDNCNKNQIDVGDANKTYALLISINALSIRNCGRRMVRMDIKISGTHWDGLETKILN